MFQALPSGCPTPCVLLARMNTFVDLLFIILATIATLSAAILLIDLWKTGES